MRKSRASTPGGRQGSIELVGKAFKLAGKKGNPGGLEARSQVMGSEGKAPRQMWLDPFGHGFGILLEFGFYSKSTEDPPEGFKQESGMI